MRILYIDIDTLRPDHLGCYGYHRDTSPNIDRIAAEGIRFDRCHASDTPCLPSRSALITGRFGIHNGVVSHGGTAADLLSEGPDRHFFAGLGRRSWAACMRWGGMKTATISSFPERHSAYHWLAGFREHHDSGFMGLESADLVTPNAINWLSANAKDDRWFLHVHYWDPHTPYRAPDNFGNPFEGDAPPGWPDEEARERHWQLPGPHSAQEMMGWATKGPWGNSFRRQPREAFSMEEVKRMYDGYDTGIRYADTHVGRLLNKLADEGVLDETAVIISSDHGETFGEMGVYGDHHTADQYVTRVPMVLRWPWLETPSGVDESLHYQIDVAATVLQLLGLTVPEGWDGQGFADELQSGDDCGRDHLVLSTGAWTVQRSVRFEDYILIRTYHDGYHGYPDVALYDLVGDPHEEFNLADEMPAKAEHGLALLDDWRGEAMAATGQSTDPIDTVLAEGGPWHVRGYLGSYLKRLRETGRGQWADLFAERYPAQAAILDAPSEF